jgi:hypothetical protein
VQPISVFHELPHQAIGRVGLQRVGAPLRADAGLRGKGGVVERLNLVHLGLKQRAVLL